MLLVRTVIVLLLGLAAGSFLNVIIDRVPRNLSILGRSRCDNCKRTLGIIDLVPVLSFVFLRGKCRFCKKKISFRNPVVEVITAALFVLTFLFTVGFNIELLFYLFIVSSLIAIFFIDLKHQIIPDKISYPAILVSLLYVIFNEQLILNHFASAGGAALFFLSLFLATRGRGLGFGDIKLAFLLGLFLGFPKILVAVYVAFLTGAGASVILILWRKKGLKDKIAFGPFLVAGGLIAFFLGEKMASRWLSFL